MGFLVGSLVFVGCFLLLAGAGIADHYGGEEAIGACVAIGMLLLIIAFILTFFGAACVVIYLGAILISIIKKTIQKMA